jgi:hypothetical protein
MAGGIYAIVNTTNSKMYVGSAVDQRSSDVQSGRLKSDLKPLVS